MNDKIRSFAEMISPAGTQTYCVIDGALVTQIKAVFETHKIIAKSIFHDRAAPEVALAGPWLVDASRSQMELERILRIARDCRSGVVWSAPCGADVLIRHLRTLNMVRLPTQEFAYFRHYDPDVLASVCPLLDGEQAARLFGPAQMIGFVVGRGAGATVGRPRDLPPAKPGPLTFSEWQMERLLHRQREISQKKICAHLRKALPLHVANTSDQDLLAIIEKNEKSARELGLDSEKAILQWTHLFIVSNGRATGDPRIRSRVSRDGPVDANHRLDEDFVDILTHVTGENIESFKGGRRNGKFV